MLSSEPRFKSHLWHIPSWAYWGWQGTNNLTSFKCLRVGWDVSNSFFTILRVSSISWWHCFQVIASDLAHCRSWVQFLQGQVHLIYTAYFTLDTILRTRASAQEFLKEWSCIIISHKFLCLISPLAYPTIQIFISFASLYFPCCWYQCIKRQLATNTASQ